MKLKLSYFLLIGIFFCLNSCGGSADATKINKTTELVESREFEIQHDWVIPMAGGRINLIGNPNFIRFKKDSVNLFLPFFGERYAGGGYNSEGGIVYEGLLKDFEITSDDKNTRTIKFSNDKGTENLDFIIKVYPEGDVNTRVNSSQRSFISYQGRIQELRKRDEE